VNVLERIKRLGTLAAVLALVGLGCILAPASMVTLAIDYAKTRRPQNDAPALPPKTSPLTKDQTV
jgi:hypothetical protein